MAVNTLLTFALAALALLVIPGPAVMYIVTRSAAQGRRAGLVSVAGIHVGTMVHVLAAMIGLSAILAASATAFTTVKLVGAAYLMWLGIQSIRAGRAIRAGQALRAGRFTVDGDDHDKDHDKDHNNCHDNCHDNDMASIEVRSLSRVFADGVLLNILNPKTALFFLSFVPQFIDPASSHPVLDLATLGGLFIALGLVSDGAYALAGDRIGSALRRSPRFRRTKDLAAGATYIGLGTVTALGGNAS